MHSQLGPVIQAKLAVGSANDQYEQEADRVAEQIVNMPESDLTAPAALQSSAALQRKCACGGTGDDECSCGMQRKAQPEESGGSHHAPQIVDQVLGSAGQPLGPDIRAYMEPRFGRDFSHVRVHTDSRAAESAEAVNALAYTVGRNIVFAARQYSSSSESGRKLLAHELTHVIQQDGMKKIQRLETPGSLAGAVLQTRSAATILQRSCGPTEIGVPNACVGIDGDVVGEHYLFTVNCDTLRPGEEARLRAFADTMTSDGSVAIHGFASIEGSSDFNDSLSCARAIATQAVIDDVVSAKGISLSYALYKHGATAGDRNERRSAYIDWLPASTFPSSTPGPVAPACVPRTGNTEYGCYCGAGSSCPAGLTCPPMDALDGCCRDHDACYDACPGCTFSDSVNPFSGNNGAARACDAALCTCVAGLTVTGRAATYRGRMQTLFRCP
jgi:outer membrane protein OmpA-like peptidoglycan-associated protein